ASAVRAEASSVTRSGSATLGLGAALRQTGLQVARRRRAVVDLQLVVSLASLLQAAKARQRVTQPQQAVRRTVRLRILLVGIKEALGGQSVLLLHQLHAGQPVHGVRRAGVLGVALNERAQCRFGARIIVLVHEGVGR